MRLRTSLFVSAGLISVSAFVYFGHSLMYSLIGACTITILMIYYSRSVSRETSAFRRISNSGIASRDHGPNSEKKVRDKIESEWNGRSVFDDAEKMK